MLKPPYLAKSVVRLVAPSGDREYLLADLREEFEQRSERNGRADARRWYRHQVARSVLPLLRRRIGGGRHRQRRGAAGQRHASGLGHDLVYAFRAMRLSLGYSLLVIGTMAVGIGATTAVVTLARPILLDPLPFADAHRLIAVRSRDATDPTRLRGVSGPDYFDYLDGMTTLTDLAGYEVVSETLSWPDRPAQRITVAAISHTTLDILGTAPALGRGFRAAEDLPGVERVVLLSHRVWRENFAGDINVLGARVVLEGRPHLIVGVMPAGFEFPSADIDLWRPLAITPTSWRRAAPILSTVGKLAPGADIEATQAEFAAMAEALGREHPASNDGRAAIVVPLHTELVGPARPALLFVGAVGLLLMMTCFNVANLMLARALARCEELAVRRALGAGRGELFRQLLVESAVLSIFGGAVGFGVAVLGVRFAAQLAPDDWYAVQQARPDPEILLLSVATSLLAALLFGTVPALRASRPHPGRSAFRSAATHDRRDTLLGRGLVVAQVTLAMVLVVSAGLFARTLGALGDVDPGFVAQGLLTARIDLPDSRYPTGMDRYPEWPEILRFYESVLSELDAIPQTTGVALGSYHPLQRSFLTSVELRELAPGIDPAEVVASPWSITPGYVTIAGMRIVSGRDLQAADRADSLPVALVNETFVRRYIPDGDPLGLHVQVFGRSARIVGVVSDVTSFGLRQQAPPTVYQSVWQAPVELLAVLVRTPVDPTALAAAVREAFWRVDAGLAPYELRPMTATLRDATGSTRFNTWLLTGFATAALLLAALGVFGILSQSVARRAREMGVRLALGAHRSQVLVLVVAEGFVMTALGLIAGAGLALAAARLMSGFLYGVAGTDPVTYAVAAALLTGTAILASLAPAARAAGSDPAAILRNE